MAETHTYIVEQRFGDGSGGTHVVHGTREQCIKRVGELLPYDKTTLAIRCASFKEAPSDD